MFIDIGHRSTSYWYSVIEFRNYWILTILSIIWASLAYSLQFKPLIRKSSVAVYDTGNMFEITYHNYNSSDAPTGVEWTNKMNISDVRQATAVTFGQGSDYSSTFNAINTHESIKIIIHLRMMTGFYFCKFTFSEGTSPEIYSDVKLLRKYLLNYNNFINLC